MSDIGAPSLAFSDLMATVVARSFARNRLYSNPQSVAKERACSPR